ncbi:MAG: COG4315 family predicted lipoprotein [Solirubrobacterales bacterium]
MLRPLRGISRRDGRRRHAPLVSLLALTLALGACGDDGESSPASGAPAAGTAPAESATVSTVDLPGFGTVLAAGSGDTVLVHTSDPAGGSSCTGKCAREFKPLEPEGEPTAGPGTDAALLSSFKRKDGTEQVLYDDKALYTHTGPGSISGAGTESHGGTWLLIEPSGDEIRGSETGGY